MTTTPSLPGAATTHQRLLEAAARVFARDGLAGATTREIARAAGVNEVTLFRHFQTKEGLLAAVVGQNFGARAAAAQPPAAVTADLRADLTDHAQRYEQVLRDNIALIRTMLGEIHHHAGHERQVFEAIFRPRREALRARLDAAVQLGQLRRGTQSGLLADMFGAMIFTGVLRRDGAHRRLEYSSPDYLAAIVDLIVRGAGPETGRT